MGFQPMGARRDSRIDTGFLPPCGFIATAMNLAVMAPAQRYGELITDLAAKRRRLRKSQMVSISRTSAADQTWLFGNCFDMLAVANPPRRRQRQYTFVHDRGSVPLFTSTSTTDWPFTFLRRGSTCSLGDNDRQPRLESLLDVLGIGCSQTVFGADNPMSPIRGLFGRVKLFQFGCESIAHSGRCLRLKYFSRAS
jgi:hypothetical protein